MHACHRGSCLTLSFFLGTVTTGAQCLCHFLIAFSPHGRGMALCRRPEEEKEGQAANLELAGREKQQHLASHEGRKYVYVHVCVSVCVRVVVVVVVVVWGDCCSSMETRTNKRGKWRGKDDEVSGRVTQSFQRNPSQRNYLWLKRDNGAQGEKGLL